MRLSSSILLVTTLAVATPATPQDWKGRARIEGRVTDESGAPIAGATVTIDRLADGSPGGPRVSSAADGRWVVDGIASGSWTVVVRAPGRRPARIGAHLPGESSWLGPLEIRLEKEEAEPTRPQDPPGGPPGSIGAVQAALEAGRVGRARGLLRSLDADGTESADDFVAAGSAFLDAGATEEAAACFGQALSLDPEHVAAHYHRALASLALGRHDEARRDLEAVVELESGGTLAARARDALDALENGGD